MTQPALLPIEHRSRQPRRLRKESAIGYGNPERVFAAEWLAENRRLRYSAVGGLGFSSLLELILTPDGERPRAVSQRDAEVAAGVIQWLGTNCGSAFLRRCEDKIDADHERAIERRRRRETREARQKDELERRSRARSSRYNRAIDVE